MSSLSQSKNFICLNLYKSELIRNFQIYSPYSLSFTFNNSPPIETDLIKFPKIAFSSKKYFLKVDKLKPKDNQLLIQAYIKTSNTNKKSFAKATIPFYLSKCKNTKEWINLKDEKCENILKVYISFNTNLPIPKKQKSKSEVFLMHELMHNKSTKFDNKHLLKSNDNITGVKLHNNKSMSNLKYTSLNKNKNVIFTQIGNIISKKLLCIREKNHSSSTSSERRKNEEDDDNKNIKDSAKKEIVKIKECQIQKKDKDKDKDKDKYKDKSNIKLKKENLKHKANGFNNRSTSTKSINKNKSLKNDKIDINTTINDININAFQLYNNTQRDEISNELNTYDNEIYQNLNFILSYSCMSVEQALKSLNQKPRQIINDVIMLNEDNGNLNRNDIHQIKSSLLNPSLKKFKEESGKSKLLNSTYFTSHWSEAYLHPMETSKTSSTIKNFSPINNKSPKKTFKKTAIKMKNCSEKRKESPEMNLYLVKMAEMRRREKISVELENIKIVIKPSKNELPTLKTKHKSTKNKKAVKFI